MYDVRQEGAGDAASGGRAARLIRPDALAKDEPLFWSPGRGTDVWEMLTAAMDGDIPAMERLVARDPALLRCSYEYRTPLGFAVREDRVAAAAWLLDRGARPQEDVLEVARERGFAGMVAMLAAKLAEIAHVSPDGERIAAAIRARNVDEVRALLDADADRVHAADARSNQPIHWAALTRQPELIDLLAERGADLDAQRVDGARPIQLAVGDYFHRGWLHEGPATPREVIAHLRARGAHCDICTASYIGDIDRVRTLLDEDPSLANRPSDYVTYYACSGTPLRNAAAGGHREIVVLLLERGADPNLPEEGIAPQGHALHSAVCNGHHDIVALLLEHGAHPNVEVESSADTLSAALMRDDARMVDLLCSYGAARRLHLLAYYDDVRTAAAMLAADPGLADDPDALANANSEAFVGLLLRVRPDLPRRVSTAKSRALTERLFRHGMDPSRPDWLRITPLHRFAASGDIENAALFLEYGADIDACDEEQRTTPLGYAARAGKRRMAEFLLRRGARPDLPAGPAWARPLGWARRRGHDAIVQILERFDEDGTLPPEPRVEEYQRLAEDVVSACTDGDAGAVGRILAWFDVDARAWQTGNAPAQAVRRFVGEKLHPERSNGGAGHVPDLEDAKWLIARANGFADWDALTRHTATVD